VLVSLEGYLYTHLAGLSIKLPSCKASTNLWRPPPVETFWDKKHQGGPQNWSWETTCCGYNPFEKTNPSCFFLQVLKGIPFSFPWWNVGTFLETNFRWIHPSCMGPKIGLGGLETLDETRKNIIFCLVLQSLIWVFCCSTRNPHRLSGNASSCLVKKLNLRVFRGEKNHGSSCKGCFKKMSVPCQLTENDQPLHPNYPLGPII